MLSAVVLLPIVTLIVWWGEPLVTVTVMLLAVLALHELFSLFRGGGYTPRRSAGFLSVLLFVIAARVRVSVEPLDWTGFALVTSIIASLSVELPRHNRDRSLLHWSLTLSGAAYIGWTLAHFVLLRDISHPLLPGSPLRLLRLDSGAAWIVFVLAVTFLSDTGAYFTGRAFGRHRMAPYISPKKSWEGAAGGVVLATLAGVGFTPLLGLPIDPWVGGLLGAIGSVAGQAGDLAESLIKRQVDIKDSGKIIPGHGGLLDRVDSLLFTAPVLYYMITIALLTR
ncbi:MAG: phosphatidate cytidylyltransferase [Chloroflexi bacterium]|nr:MAG: phosphatidate cytidylyltransferase [Chloroflexota bacterium]